MHAYTHTQLQYLYAHKNVHVPTYIAVDPLPHGKISRCGKISRKYSNLIYSFCNAAVLGSLSEEAKIDLYHKITKDVDVMKRKFSSLQNKIWIKMKEQQDMIVELALGMGILSEDDEKRIYESPSEVRKILTKYWSFLDYGNLEHIVEEICGEEDQKRMKEYTVELKKFCERRVSEFPSGSLGNDSKHPGMEKLYVTLNLNDPFLKRIKDLKVVFANILGCPASKLVLQNIESGSVLVTFLITTTLGSKMFERSSLTDEQKEELRKEQVISIKYGSVYVYSIHNDGYPVSGLCYTMHHDVI